VLPLAATAGLLLALVLDGARYVLHAGAHALRRLAPVLRPAFPVPMAARPAPAPALRRLPALVAAGAGRGPPTVG
jgi:hypothetical protein